MTARESYAVMISLKNAFGGWDAKFTLAQAEGVLRPMDPVTIKYHLDWCTDNGYIGLTGGTKDDEPLYEFFVEITHYIP